MQTQRLSQNEKIRSQEQLASCISDKGLSLGEKDYTDSSWKLLDKECWN